MATITQIPKTTPLWTLVKLQGQALPVITRDKSIIRPTTLGQGISLTTNLPQLTQNVLNSVISKQYDKASNDYIDVVNDFQWTISPKTSREDVPVVYLTEKRLVANSNISNIANSIYATVETGKNLANNISNTLANPVNAAANTGAGQRIVADGNRVADVAQSVTEQVLQSETFQQISKSASTINEFINKNFDRPSRFNSSLAPYDQLYATETTGFNYKLPYFSDDFLSTSVSFSQGTSPGLLGGLAGIATGIAEGISNIAGSLQPGVYIEKSKVFSMGDSGRSVTVNFPLLNTKSLEDIPKNWQLIFGLIYQNKPGRYTRSVIDVPVIYELLIPGMTYMPYSYVSQLAVSFVGSRRIMSLPIPSDKGGSINAIIPDAYNVSITFTGMNEETRNFMYASIHDTVTVSGLPNITITTPGGLA